jgi:hypothetical protein
MRYNVVKHREHLGPYASAEGLVIHEDFNK